MDVSSYSLAVRNLLSTQRLQPLGSGHLQEELRPILSGLTVDQRSAAQVQKRAFAESCLAGLLLYHDFLDEAHSLSQSINTVEGSYWHALMHRRESDYANAAYWFRHVGQHPVFADLAAASEQLASTSAATVSIPSPWDPFWFIDFCEACAKGRQAGENLALLLQQREWELLFDYCYQRAIA